MKVFILTLTLAFVICRLQNGDEDLEIGTLGVDDLPSGMMAKAMRVRTVCSHWIPDRICKAASRPIKVVQIGQKDVSFYNCGFNHKAAQYQCGRDGGKLWEPTNKSEYEAVFEAISYNYNNSSPGFLFECFHWWIGFKNTDQHAGRAAHYASNDIGAWRSLNENNGNEDCVDIYGGKDKWGDHPCDYHLPFICELENVCDLPCCRNCKAC